MAGETKILLWGHHPRSRQEMPAVCVGRTEKKDVGKKVYFVSCFRVPVMCSRGGGMHLLED